jgi:3-hydroxy-9,10-secoandrosta-1,3,5(10)-triene-9,17-dione monooxygenase reductase component
MTTTARFDPRDFRQALGRFATGVTIVTTRAADGTPLGMTANSFNSVSMDPPMVLWSLARTARSLAAFSQATHWNVHILANDQEALSNRFARAGEDKFAGLTLDDSAGGAPLIPGCSARFQCRTAFQYEGGDHIIFVGEVMDFDRSERAPLVFVTGGYALATRLSGDISTAPQAQTDAAPYSENLLGYLLGRAHYQFMAGFRPTLEARGLSETDFFILSLLAVRSPLTAAEIAGHMAYTGVDVGPATLGRLCTRGLLSTRNNSREAGFELSAQGRDDILHVMAAAKAREAELLDQVGPLEAASLRNLLKRLIAASDPGLPPLWA